MNTMGKLSRYISKGVNTVSGPFHPFGGAIDIIVVEQPDGSFKSSPWYVRFGKFQGVLIARENVVNIDVNGIKANIYMHLDHRGEAYFLREVDAEEADAFIVSSASSDETERRAAKIRRPMKVKSCSYDSLNELDDSAKNKKLGRSISRRTKLMGMVFGRSSSSNESNVSEVKECSNMARLGSLERAEIAADLLDLHWTTNLATSKPKSNFVLHRSSLNGNHKLDKENIGLTSIDKYGGIQKSFRIDEVSIKMDYFAEPKLVSETANFCSVTHNETSVLQDVVLESNSDSINRRNNVRESEENSSRFCACKDRVLSYSKTACRSSDEETGTSTYSPGSHFLTEETDNSSNNEPSVSTVYESISIEDGHKGENSANEVSRASAVSSDTSYEQEEPTVIKKKARVNTPTSDHLKSLNLQEGKNTVTFTFFSPMLGKYEIDARIYLWKWNTRVVISDVDGTITKSDVLGQFMPFVGVDWSQTGVANLFSAIKENGYQLLFLSARAISQANLTRKFLFNIKQNGKTLPDGPVVISPDGLFPSLFREVIRRAPHEFKIGCLTEIKALFPGDCNPFHAGFGNRDTDEISYLKVGVPKGKIFIINPKGQVAVNRCVDTRSYHSLHGLVNGVFPSLLSSEQEDFNTWNFWKLPPPLIDA